MPLDETDAALIDGWQRSFPVEPQPFARIAVAMSLTEADVLARLGSLSTAGIISRIGATVRPNTVGASLLAAMRVAPEDLERIAGIISSERCVNHNYEREHRFSLWFVVTAPDRRGLDAALARLRAATAHDILELPMERAYYLDLGFPLTRADAPRRPSAGAGPLAGPIAVSLDDRRILAEMEDGLDIVSRPYAALARRCGLDEADVIARIARLVASGIVSRLGLIVRHRSVGFTANAMTVWDVPADRVDDVGLALAAENRVTLCYRRPRRLPHWRYNLFAMVHGRERAEVVGEIARMAARLGLGTIPREILFSRRCFSQRGARFKAA